MSVTVPATRYIKKKGDESGKYLILTRSLTQALADGVFEEITEAEARAYDEKKEEIGLILCSIEMFLTSYDNETLWERIIDGINILK